jgi:hypothetical protein
MLTVLTHIRSFEVVQMRLKAEESATLSAIGTVCSIKRMAVPRGSYVGLEAIAPLSNDPIAKLSASARAGPRSHGLQQPRPRGQTSENRSTVS